MIYIQGEGSNSFMGTCTKFVHSGRRESVCTETCASLLTGGPSSVLVLLRPCYQGYTIYYYAGILDNTNTLFIWKLIFKVYITLFLFELVSLNNNLVHLHNS